MMTHLYFINVLFSPSKMNLFKVFWIDLLEFSSLYIINYQKWRHIHYFTRNKGPTRTLDTHQCRFVNPINRFVDEAVRWSLQGTTQNMGISWRHGWSTTRSWPMEKIKIVKTMTHERHQVLKIVLIWNDSSSDIIFYLKRHDHFIQIKFRLVLSNVPKGMF